MKAFSDNAHSVLLNVDGSCMFPRGLAIGNLHCNFEVLYVLYQPSCSRKWFLSSEGQYVLWGKRKTAQTFSIRFRQYVLQHEQLILLLRAVIG